MQLYGVVCAETGGLSTLVSERLGVVPETPCSSFSVLSMLLFFFFCSEAVVWSETKMIVGVLRHKDVKVSSKMHKV